MIAHVSQRIGQIAEMEDWAVDDCIAQFLRFLTVEKNASPNTISAYRNDLTQFGAFIRDKGHPKGLEGCRAATQPVVLEFISSLRERGYKDATVARKVASVKSFFGFLTAEGLIDEDPTETLKSPQVGKALPRALTVAEVDELLEQPSKGRRTAERERDRAMLELAYATGFRVTELVSLRLGDLSLDSNPPTVRCTGKGDRERVLPIPSGTARELRYYLDHVRPRLKRRLSRGRSLLSEPVFVTRRGGEGLTRQGFWLILKHYAEQAGLGWMTPHTLRHTFATHMLNGGMPLRNVQDALGHASISTTQVYTHLTDKEKRREYDKAHPRA
ncbi:MAG: tyrosine recombinase [Dehalococcoidia bacterium]